MLNTFPWRKQLNKYDCGPTCVQILLDFHNISNNYSKEQIREICSLENDGTSIKNLINGLKKIGFNSNMLNLDISELKKIDLPLILFFKNNHFVILYKIKNEKYWISDPNVGRYKLTESLFKENWTLTSQKGVAISAIPFVTKTNKQNHLVQKTTLNFRNLFKEVLSNKKSIKLVGFVLILSSIIQLIIPFVTKSVVDIGIENRDTDFVTLLLLAQGMLFVSITSMDFLRRWILLHIGLKLNLILSISFVKSILGKSITYFENKKDGDFLQRLIDKNRIESFLTNTSLNLLVAIINLLMFGAVLLIFELKIFIVFIISSILSISWIYLFQKKRKKLDYNRFKISAHSRTKLLEIINGIEDIQLNNISSQQLDKWIEIQENYLLIRMKMLELGQFQKGGALSINQAKNILITFLSAYSVISGTMTLGEMLAIQYIIGQLNSPVREIVGFIQSYQDANLSLERISDITNEINLDKLETTPNQNLTFHKKSISIENLNYSSLDGKNILKSINLNIPYGQNIGIVGQSGSGKTTLLKLILGLLKTDDGSIFIGNIDINTLNKLQISNLFSASLNDSYLFSDSILYNITLELKEANICFDRLEKVLEHCLLKKLLDNLPDGYETKIGKGGQVLSKGQRQKILIARTLYKNSNYLIFDEFTNFLDNVSKERILHNVYANYNSKTIISVSHKINDLRFCDNIICLSDGKVVEQGSPEELIKNEKYYFNLYKAENEQ